MLRLLFAVAALAVTAPLAASERDMPQTVHIQFADLDLSSTPGKVALDRRIEDALHALCFNDQQLGLSQRLHEINCRRVAAAQIEPQRERVIASAIRRPMLANEMTVRSTSRTN